MSRDGGRAASIAAVTGAGSGGLRDRFATRAAQLDRLVSLKAQLHWHDAHGNKRAAEETRRDMREIEALKHQAP